MKKILLSIFILLTIISFTGCGNNKEDSDQKNNKKEDIISNGNSVVIYFSATGTTKKIAERIANLSKSDLIEIVPEEAYTSKDLDYNNDCRANREQNDSKARPKIKNSIDISKYDTIYLGYPIWWGTNPKIILTLLDSYDFSGKTIIPFCTSGSSGIENSVSNLRSYKSSLNIKDGKRFSSNSSDDEIKKFINDNNEVVNSMKIIINNKEYQVNLENNETVNSLIKLLPMELNMSELNGNEKYFYLDSKLPTNSYSPKRINKGDIMLYGDNCIVIFYKDFDTSYSYTKIGHIDNLDDLGNGNILVKFSKEDNHSFRGTIVECMDNSMIVRPNEDEMEYKSSDKFSVPFISDFNSCKVNDSVLITYNGGINESYPAQINVIKIEVIK